MTKTPIIKPTSIISKNPKDGGITIKSSKMAPQLEVGGGKNTGLNGSKLSMKEPTND